MSTEPKQTSPKVPERIDLSIDSDPANLRHIRQQVELFARAAGFSQEICDAVGLAVNEALANVIRHGYGGATDQPILLKLERSDGELRLFVRDWGKRFDPAKLPNPEQLAAKRAEELMPGGLGLLCMKQIMDHVEFIPQNDGMLLKMIKRAKPLEKK
jgi:anti-sigma regulatory factor (Ser/Thr protein kinase)